MFAKVQLYFEQHNFICEINYKYSTSKLDKNSSVNLSASQIVWHGILLVCHVCDPIV